MFISCIMHFGRKLKKAGHFGNKALKHGARFGMKSGKVMVQVGKVGEALGVPGSEELLMAGKATRKGSKQVERVRKHHCESHSYDVSGDTPRTPTKGNS